MTEAHEICDALSRLNIAAVGEYGPAPMEVIVHLEGEHCGGQKRINLARDFNVRGRWEAAYETYGYSDGYGDLEDGPASDAPAEEVAAWVETLV